MWDGCIKFVLWKGAGDGCIDFRFELPAFVFQLLDGVMTQARAEMMGVGQTDGCGALAAMRSKANLARGFSGAGRTGHEPVLSRFHQGMRRPFVWLCSCNS